MALNARDILPPGWGDECRCHTCVNDPPWQFVGERVVESPPLVPALPSQRRIIAFTGLAGSGKSTAAMHLVEQGWPRVRFAGPLKAMMAALGLTPAQIDGDQKEVPCDLLCGKTPRWAMQSIGTEWGRELIGPDIWTNAWRASLPATGNVVVDDCRFPNEAEAVRMEGGGIVRIDCPIIRRDTSAAGHVSETYALPADMTVRNTGSMADFLTLIDQAAVDISWALAGTH